MAKITFLTDRCKGCGLCVYACPKHLLYLDSKTINSKGHNYVAITDMSKCTGCTSCAIMCPDIVISVER